MVLEYVPGPRCVELKAFKLYLWHFRNEPAFYEDTTNQIVADLVAGLDPRWLRLTSIWNVRGGVYTSVVVEHGDAALATPYPDLAAARLTETQKRVCGRAGGQSPAQAPASRISIRWGVTRRESRN